MLLPRLLRVFFVSFPMCLAAIPARAEPVDEGAMLEPFPHPRGYVCYRASSPVKIDGKLSDPAWEAVPWSEPFVDIEGDKKPRPRFQTRMKMLWDDEALYVAAELEEPHVWARLTEHDSVIFNDNDFEMFLNPSGDSHLYGELELNARNTTWDLLLTKPYKDGGRAITSWEIQGLKTAVHVDGTLDDARDVDKGWSVEIKWPWAGLKELADGSLVLPPRDGNKWRVNFSRVEWDIEIIKGQYVKVPKRPEHNWVWSPQGVVDMHRPERWGYVQFSTQKPGTVAFQPDGDWQARDELHRIYYAEKAFYKAHGKYAKTLQELGWKPASRVVLETTRSGFEASLALPKGLEGKERRMSIAQDAHIWME